jgi:predicted nucleotidyltransferase
MLCASALSGQTLFQREVHLHNDTFASYFVIRDIVQKDANTFKVLGYYENERGTYTYRNFIADMDLEGNLSQFVFYKSMISAFYPDQIEQGRICYGR